MLNPSGLRFGPAEVYSIVASFTTIEDYICVGRRRSQDTDEQVMLFIKMKAGFSLCSSLERQIRITISTSLSPRHVPKFIIQVPHIPYNKNGKKLETLVKRVVSGGRIEAKVQETLAQPGDLDDYMRFARLEDLGRILNAKI